jgi:hypothetical protein
MNLWAAVFFAGRGAWLSGQELCFFCGGGNFFVLGGGFCG